MGIECVYVWGVLMWKNLYLFFCFLESANNVRTKHVQPPETKSERSVLIIEIENNNHFATRKTTNQKCLFPPFLSHIFLSLSGPRV